MGQWIAQAFTNPYFVAIASPTVLLVLAALGRSAIKREWCLRYWYLGFEASLTALYAGIIYLFDIAKDKNLLTGSKVAITGGFLLWAFVFFIVVTICHMFWEQDGKHPKPIKQFLVLGLFANSLGFGLLLAFVLLVKDVS